MKSTRTTKLRLNKDTLLRLSDRELSFAAAAANVGPRVVTQPVGVDSIVLSVTTPRFRCC